MKIKWLLWLNLKKNSKLFIQYWRCTTRAFWITYNNNNIHPMPVGAGETLTNSDFQSSRSAIAAISSVPARPVSSSIVDFSVTNGRPTLLFASGVQSRSFSAGSSWRLTWPASARCLCLTILDKWGREPYNDLFVRWFLQEMLYASRSIVHI